MNKLAWTFSILTHISIYLVALSVTISSKSQPNPTLNDKFKGSIQIVDVDPRLKSKIAPETNRRAKHNQSTKKETVAKQGVSGSNPQENEIPAQDGFGSAPKSITQKGKSDPKIQGKGVSASDDFIEGAEIGPMTILNAQEYKYFSYYERIKTRVVENWRPLIRKAIKTVKNDPKKYGELLVGHKITKLEINLNANGEIIEIIVKQSSGFQIFDDAADKAFRQSAPFSSPPKELVADGIFTIRWDFIVAVEEAGLVQFNTGNIGR